MTVWDVPHMRGAGLTVQILHVGQTYPTLALLHRHPRMHSVEVARALDPDAPNVHAASRTLSMLRRAGLTRHGPGQSEPGVHAVHEPTALGADMMSSLRPLGDWGTTRFGIDDWRDAAGATIGLFTKRWTFTLMMVIVNAGPDGIRPERAQDAVNDLMASQREDIPHRMHPSTRHAALDHLRGAGLVSRRSAPTARHPARVLYSMSPAGWALTESLWTVAEWAMPHDAHLSACVGMMTSWWDAPDARM